MRNRVTKYLAGGSILSGIMTLGRGLITSFLGRRLNAQWHVDARVTRQQRRSGRKLITWQTSGMLLTLASLGSNLGGSAIATLGGSALLRVASRGSLSVTPLCSPRSATSDPKRTCTATLTSACVPPSASVRAATSASVLPSANALLLLAVVPSPLPLPSPLPSTSTSASVLPSAVRYCS